MPVQTAPHAQCVLTPTHTKSALSAYRHLIPMSMGMALSMLFGLFGAALFQLNKKDEFRRRLLTPEGPMAVNLDVDGILLTTAHGQHVPIGWHYVERWLEGQDYFLLVTTNGYGAIIPKTGMPHGMPETIGQALTAIAGKGKRTRTWSFSERGPVYAVLAIVGIVIGGVLAVFVALAIVLQLTGPLDDAPERPPAADVSTQQPTTSSPMVDTSDLSAPLVPSDVPAPCSNIGSDSAPEWMCWDEDGNQEWTTDELPPGCRMVPFRGNMYLDCEAASGPGR